MAGATPSEYAVEADERRAYLSPRLDFVLLTVFTAVLIGASTVLLLP